LAWELHSKDPTMVFLRYGIEKILYTQ
jgi:hypothetical protein